MGKEFKMARSKRKGEGVLLVKGRARLPVYSSSGRNKRKKTATTVKETEGGKIKDSTSASQVGAEVEGPYADSAGRTERDRYSQDDKDRKSDRGVEGKDKPARRSSVIMEVEL